MRRSPCTSCFSTCLVGSWSAYANAEGLDARSVFYLRSGLTVLAAFGALELFRTRLSDARERAPGGALAFRVLIYSIVAGVIVATSLQPFVGLEVDRFRAAGKEWQARLSFSCMVSGWQCA